MYNHCCCGNALSITYCECMFIALGIQHAMRMRHIAICGLSRSTVFSHVCHEQHDFRKKKKLFNIKCAFRLALQFLSGTFFHSKIKNVHRASCKVTFILFSRLYDVPTSSCAHLTIILSSSSICLCHSSLLPLITFPPSVL